MQDPIGMEFIFEPWNIFLKIKKYLSTLREKSTKAASYLILIMAWKSWQQPKK